MRSVVASASESVMLQLLKALTWKVRLSYAGTVAQPSETSDQVRRPISKLSAQGHCQRSKTA